MKSLIVVAGHATNTYKKLVEIELLEKLKVLRDNFDILYISHKPIGELVYDYIDYGIYDKKNTLVTEPEYKPNLWFGNDNFGIISSTFYRNVTHVAIFRMMSIANNFATHMKYEKIHYVEYDLDLDNVFIFNDVDNELKENDSVVFINNENNWLFGCYFAYNIKKYNFLDDFDESTFLSYLKLSDNNFTERTLEKLFFDGKKVKKLSMQENFKSRGQKIKSLTDESILQWCVPYYDEDNDKLMFLVNLDKKSDFFIKIIINDKKIVTFDIKDNHLNQFFLKELGLKDNIEKIEVFCNGKKDYLIDFNNVNKEEFIKYNRKVIK